MAETGNLTQVAYQKLKEDIVTCVLQPGSQVTEAMLSLRLDMSKAPLRGALARLMQDGLVVPLPRQGYRIAPVTIRDADELFDMRLLLEPAAARSAAGRIDVVSLRKLDAVCRAGYRPGNRASERQFLRANSEFHVAIARATGNRRLASAIASVLDEIERIQHVGMTMQDRSMEIRDEHQALLDVLEQGDGDGAAAMMIEQIRAARQMVVDALMGSTAIRDVALTVSRVKHGSLARDLKRRSA
jgi:DNA-binding GntR family transcriptional regulator